MLGTRTQRDRMEGAEESTELWRHPNFYLSLRFDKMPKNLFQVGLHTHERVRAVRPQEDRGILAVVDGRKGRERRDVDRERRRSSSAKNLGSEIVRLRMSPFRQTALPIRVVVIKPESDLIKVVFVVTLETRLHVGFAFCEIAISD